MRQIKFRGLRTDGKGWVYGAYVPSGVNPYDIIIDGKDEHAVIASSVGQFTGLTDKNGKEIFEGDVVKVHGRGSDFWTGAVVEYHAPSFMIQKNKGVCDEFRWGEWESDFEVIRNIHEQ